MTYLRKLKDNKSQVQKDEAFCFLLESKLPDPQKPITDLLDEFDAAILKEDKNITREALSNVHGDWYEWLLAIAAWNSFVDSKKSHLAILLPNVSQFDVAKLYVPSLFSLIEDLRKKVSETAGVKLITSNPDFVIINTDRVKQLKLNLKRIDVADTAGLMKLQEAYKNFIGQCEFDDIEGYISVKTSLRPDRRLQIPHEGSLMKALYIHLQTRQWVINPKGLKYYAMATKIGNPDREALKTVATHSITTVHSLPQAAVDDVFEVNSLQQAGLAFAKILNA
jgi:hypothetical protein